VGVKFGPVKLRLFFLLAEKAQIARASKKKNMGRKGSKSISGCWTDQARPPSGTVYLSPKTESEHALFRWRPFQNFEIALPIPTEKRQPSPLLPRPPPAVPLAFPRPPLNPFRPTSPSLSPPSYTGTNTPPSLSLPFAFSLCGLGLDRRV